MNIKDFRSQHPEYDKISDSELADAMYNKFYSGKIDRKEFNNRFLGAPKVTTAELQKKDIQSMSGYEKFMTGVGSGMYGLYEGVKQKGAQLGESVGAISPETVKRITEEGEYSRELTQPLMEESNAARVGQFVGEVAPTMVVPGGVTGGALKRAATSALSGGALGAVRFTGKDESALQNVATGAAFGAGTSAALTGAGKVVNALTSGAGSHVATEAETLGRKYKIPTTLGEDIGNTAVQKLETLLEKVPVTGIRKFREKQLTAADDAAKGFLGKYIADPTTPTIEGNRAFSSAQFESLKSMVNDVKDIPIFAEETSKQANSLLSRYPDLFKKFQDTSRESIIKDVASGTSIPTGYDIVLGNVTKPKTTFADIWSLRDGLGEMIGQAKSKLRSGDVDRTTISQLNSLYRAVNNDIESWANQVGKPELKTAISSANEAYKNYVVKYSLLKKAYDEAAGTTSAKEMFSPKTFSTLLKKIISKDKEFGTFTPAEIEEMAGLANIMQVVKRAGQYAENPPTGNRLIDAALTGGGAVGAITNTMATAKTAGATGGLSLLAKFLTTTESGKNLVRAASKVEPNSDAMRKIVDKAYTIAPRALEGIIRNKVDLPSIVSSAEAAGYGTYLDQQSRRKAIEEATGEVTRQEAPAPRRAVETERTQTALPRNMTKEELSKYDADTRKLAEELARRKASEDSSKAAPSSIKKTYMVVYEGNTKKLMDDETGDIIPYDPKLDPERKGKR